ncbi:MAG: DUF2934 domain-containing protein [Candidatus Brocadiia bacterium]
MAKMAREMNRNNSARTSNNQELAEQIKKCAYELYCKRGQTHGNDLSDWLNAEREIKHKNGYKL